MIYLVCKIILPFCEAKSKHWGPSYDWTPNQTVKKALISLGMAILCQVQ